MLQKLQNHLNKDLPFLKGKKLLLAVSGGIDSMVLVHLLHQLQFDVSVAHCNFNLRRDESNGDEEFVKSFCKNLNIGFFVNNFDTKRYADLHKLSIQVAARQLRYNWFNELLEKEGFDYLLTAHHLDDSIETFLINFTRGTGLDGLTGIPQQNDKIIRPFLIFTREEIENYSKENQIEWREDSSNVSDKYLRNKLRHKVIPILKELNPGFSDSFLQTIENLQQSESMIDDASRIVYRKVVEDVDDQKRINLSKLMVLPNYQAYLYQWLKPFGFKAWKDIYDLVEAQSGKQVFSERYRLLKDRDTLILTEKKEFEKEVYAVYEEAENSKIPLKISVCDKEDIAYGNKDIIFVDKDTLKFPLEFRKWEEGDYFYPFGITGKKKLSKYFKDEKFSLIEKENTWLLCSENLVVWLVGKRADRRFSVNEKTQTIIKIELK
ncbi:MULTISPECIES: tRNA lysidine(34) synthetase TilS [Flavobacterium]|uniref:tRNA lysidine(34) synthetase TilS n=1 Tax=Flavobacterium TaxID=237 RepID=UPI001FCA8B04|nr:MULTISPECIES: tRNA lysidine(34) synthetase TilS [Flavobacterium]UOK41543.1 tRNA lysidine(34) synthetase TilS [Flavobacterium enshiense]